jgi:maltose/moltooligosaccharide transporter
MGVINMMIVIPMFIQTTTFGFILKHFLNNNPCNAITFAGVFLLIAAVLTLLINSDTPAGEITLAGGGGH